MDLVLDVLTIDEADHGIDGHQHHGGRRRHLIEKTHEASLRTQCFRCIDVAVRFAFSPGKVVGALTFSETRKSSVSVANEAMSMPDPPMAEHSPPRKPAATRTRAFKELKTRHTYIYIHTSASSCVGC